jgi:hypothetical protein
LALIGIGVLFVLLVICIVVAIIQNRRVSQQYALLINESSKTREMDTIDNTPENNA